MPSLSLRAVRVRSGQADGGTPPVEILLLDHQQRRSGRGNWVGTHGHAVVLQLPTPVRLRTDDLLETEDGRCVLVVAAPEPLYEIRIPDLPALARLAWHFGDRHLPVEVQPQRLRVRRDAAADALIRDLGHAARAIEAPFEPEGGAYD